MFGLRDACSYIMDSFMWRDRAWKDVVAGAGGAERRMYVQGSFEIGYNFSLLSSSVNDLYTQAALGAQRLGRDQKNCLEKGQVRIYF